MSTYNVTAYVIGRILTISTDKSFHLKQGSVNRPKSISSICVYRRIGGRVEFSHAHVYVQHLDDYPLTLKV